MKREIEFAHYMVNRQYDEAYSMLSDKDKLQWTIAKLEEKYTGMFSYCTGNVTSIKEVIVPDADPGWFYIGISGDGFNEAITGIVLSDGTISTIEFGRP